MAEQIRNNINSSAGPPTHADIVIAAHLMGVKGKVVNIIHAVLLLMDMLYSITGHFFFECLMDSIIIKYSFSLVNSKCYYQADTMNI